MGETDCMVKERGYAPLVHIKIVLDKNRVNYVHVFCMPPLLFECPVLLGR